MMGNNASAVAARFIATHLLLAGVPLTRRYRRGDHALVRAIEALGIIQPTSPFERALARLLMAAYKRRLRGIVAAAPTWASEEILSVSEHFADRRAAVWMPAQWFDLYPEWQYTMCV